MYNMDPKCTSTVCHIDSISIHTSITGPKVRFLTTGNVAERWVVAHVPGNNPI